MCTHLYVLIEFCITAYVLLCLACELVKVARKWTNLEHAKLALLGAIKT